MPPCQGCRELKLSQEQGHKLRALIVRRLRTHMPYGLIPLIVSIALTGLYVFATEASFWSKALVAGLLVLSLVWRYGLFIQVALSVFLLLYFTYLKSRA